MSIKVYDGRKTITLGDKRKSKQVKFRATIFKKRLNSSNPTGLIDSDNKKLSLNSKSSKRISHFISTNFSLRLNDPVITVLESIEEIVIKQEADIMEAVVGCQKPNNYHVYGRLSNKQLIYLFKCREFSGCCMRFCCPVDCRGFDMKIKYMKGGKNNKNDFNKDVYLNIAKPLKCACICLCRPEINVEFSYSNKKSNILGKIRYLFSLIDQKFEVINNEGKTLYSIVGNCCQCGLVCRNNVLGKTDEVHFFIYKPNEENKPVGDICKKSNDSLLSIADDYIITLPKDSEPEEKLLLTVAGLMIDYQYFEKNGNAGPKY